MRVRLRVSTLRDEAKEYETVLGQLGSCVYSAHWMGLPNEDSMETGSVPRSDRQRQVLNTVMQRCAEGRFTGQRTGLRWSNSKCHPNDPRISSLQHA